MNERTEYTWRRPVVALVAVGLIGLGSLATYLVMRSQVAERPVAGDAATTPPTTAPASVSAGTSSAEPLPDLSLTLSKEGADRAGIVVSRVTASTTGGGL